jgi:hypothetical protein
VAASGDTVIVGAAYGDSFTGSVYVYDLSSGSAVLTTTISDPAAAVGDEFGASIAISGDTIAVGARSDDAGANDAGRVYLYKLTGASAVLTDTLNNPTPAANDQFGYSVAVNQDTVVIGAINDDSGSGSIYIYDLSSGSAVLTTGVSNPTPGTNENFGGSVAISDNTVVVGARGDNTGASYTGSAYVYAGATTCASRHARHHTR